jgi:L-lactate utilization protein LutC
MNYNQLATKEVRQLTLENLAKNNITPHEVETGAEARLLISKLIPDAASVMTGSSTTLDQIGFTEQLKSGQHPWNNLKAAIVAETDPTQQNHLRRQSILADYFLGSVHALTQAGQTVVASATGSQLPAYAFSSPNVIWVVGAQKIVPDLDEAFKRIREHVFPLEDARMKSTGASGSTLGKWLIFEKEVMSRSIHLILVNEILGF